MKIAQKLGLLVGALLAALLLTILVLSAQVAATSREYNSLIDNEIQQRADSVTMLVNFNKQVLDYQQILLQADTEDEYVALKKVYDAQIELVDKLTDQLLSNVGPEDPRLRTSLQQFKTTHSA